METNSNYWVENVNTEKIFIKSDCLDHFEYEAMKTYILFPWSDKSLMIASGDLEKAKFPPIDASSNFASLLQPQG